MLPGIYQSGKYDRYQVVKKYPAIRANRNTGQLQKALLQIISLFLPVVVQWHTITTVLDIMENLHHHRMRSTVGTLLNKNG